MRRQIASSLIAGFTALLMFVPLAAQAPEARAPELALTPNVVDMGTFYNGARLEVKGKVAEGSGVVVAIRGPEIEESFNKKGKVGPIWYNAAKVHISGVPSLFLCYSSGPLGGLLSREALDSAQLDEVAIRAQMKVQPPEQDNPTVRDNYLTLKRQQKIYQLFEGSVTMGGAEGGSQGFTLDLAWPKNAPPTDYDVTVYECRNQGVAARASAPLEVVEVGFPARLAKMANDQAYLYGLIAVLAAIIVGFGIDFIASRLGKKGVAAH